MNRLGIAAEKAYGPGTGSQSVQDLGDVLVLVVALEIQEEVVVSRIVSEWHRCDAGQVHIGIGE